MTDSIDLTKFNIMTDSMYDTTGTQMNEVKRNMVYTTPFEQQAKYNMRAGNKPFQASKYPSSGHEWYAKRAVNDVDLQTDMEKVLPDQQVQNWSRVKTVILQKEDAKPKETATESQLEHSRNKEIHKTLERIKRRHANKKKEGYITSPFGDYEDTWSSAGKIKDQLEEKFTVAGKEFEIIDIIIVILAIIIIIVAVYIYINKKKNNEAKTTSSTIPDEIIDDEIPQYEPYESNIPDTDNEYLSNDKIDEVISDSADLEEPSPTPKTSGGEGQVLDCGSLCGGAAFDTKI